MRDRGGIVNVSYDFLPGMFPENPASLWEGTFHFGKYFNLKDYHILARDAIAQRAAG